MFTEPVLELDSFLLEQHLSDIKARKEELLAKLGGSAGEAKKNIMSNPKFAKLLELWGCWHLKYESEIPPEVVEWLGQLPDSDKALPGSWAE